MRAWLSATLVLLALNKLHAAEYSFEPLGIPGAVNSIAFGINNHGAVVGSYEDEAGAFHGFLHEAGVTTVIDVPGGEDTEAMGINDAGDIVGLYFPLLDEEEMDPDDPFNFFDLSLPSFHYDGAAFTDVVVPGTFATLALAINNQDVIAGSTIDALFPTGSVFLQSEAETAVFTYPEGADSGATDINDRDEVVGFFFEGLEDLVGGSFLRSEDGFSILSVPNSQLTSAEGINNATQVVGYYVDDDDLAHGFLLSDGDFATIDMPAARQTEIYDINDTGVFVGAFYDDQDQSRAFLARQVTPGDFNSDGAIDLEDFAILASNFNATGLFAQGDLDGNFWVNLADFDQFRTLLLGQTSQGVSVPAPSNPLVAWCVAPLILNLRPTRSTRRSRAARIRMP